MNAMTSLKIASAAICLALAACAPKQVPVTAPDVVDFHPVISQNAIADGRVFEYHDTMDYPRVARFAVHDGHVFEYH